MLEMPVSFIETFNTLKPFQILFKDLFVIPEFWAREFKTVCISKVSFLFKNC